jgi:hypothetical protein
MDVEDAHVRVVLHDRIWFARLFMDLHRAVEPVRIVVASGGRRARRGEDQESQSSEEGQEP